MRYSLSYEIACGTLLTCFTVFVAMRIRRLRKYLLQKPRTPDKTSGNTYPISIGRDVVYVSESEKNSFDRGMRLPFLLVGMLLASILTGRYFARVFGF